MVLVRHARRKEICARGQKVLSRLMNDVDGIVSDCQEGAANVRDLRNIIIRSLKIRRTFRDSAAPTFGSVASFDRIDLPSQQAFPLRHPARKLLAGVLALVLAEELVEMLLELLAQVLAEKALGDDVNDIVPLPMDDCPRKRKATDIGRAENAILGGSQHKVHRMRGAPVYLGVTINGMQENLASSLIDSQNGASHGDRLSTLLSVTNPLHHRRPTLSPSRTKENSPT
ncbi:uncharacterized protein NECHADRAFT_88990 [Fusarium vanettenii 77-13-4]|uniref:Uncharacterized protein n=1 Tax=Fusarium vanettenii (strain ATCC MYA-4622 / CBS 123669 / FGSC 9596 / NRRL 45880 / 77-13-4) TaxID=660122 RepID=C7ZPR4_FUSV7|nr:uncharacterized protein NECHADRAFT_88990 [Fusarium vanettenii 77-13-4]EEU33989.1 predicted protein [Fusarium vanettenii 77-13-4]